MQIIHETVNLNYGEFYFSFYSHQKPYKLVAMQEQIFVKFNLRI